MRSALVLAVVLTLSLGCSMASKSRIRVIDVPSGLTEQQVELAILDALTDTHWFLEGRNPGVVMAGIERKGHYLRVAITHNTRWVSFKIDGSRHLRETDSFIHAAAIKWIRNLEIRVRHSLGEALAQQIDVPG